MKTDIEVIRALVELGDKATPGTWEHKRAGTIIAHPDKSVIQERGSLIDWICAMQGSNRPNADNDAGFIVESANARPALRAMLARLDKLEKVAKAAKKLLASGTAADLADDWLALRAALKEAKDA